MADSNKSTDSKPNNPKPESTSSSTPKPSSLDREVTQATDHKEEIKRPDKLADVKDTKPKRNEPGKLAAIFMTESKDDDDPILKMLASFQNMLLQETDLLKKLNVFTAIPRMIMAAPDAIKAAPDKIMDTGKKIMDNLQEGINKFKNFFEYKASDKKDNDPKESPITTPKKEITATNPVLSAVSDTQGTKAQLDSIADNVITGGEIKTERQETKQAIEAGSKTIADDQKDAEKNDHNENKPHLG